MEICETSGLPIPMVLRFHQSNDYIKRKLCVRTAQKCNALVGAETVLTCVGLQTIPFHGDQYRAKNRNIRNSGLHIPMVLRLHQSNAHSKRKLRVWRAQKTNTLVGAETVLPSAGLQTTPFHGDQNRAKNGNMRNFGVANPHVSAFALKP